MASTPSSISESASATISTLEGWLRDEPGWGWSWIGWADSYRFTSTPARRATLSLRQRQEVQEMLRPLTADTGRGRRRRRPFPVDTTPVDGRVRVHPLAPS